MNHWIASTILLAAAANAQDVPLPPKPDTTHTALAPLLETLKETLLSVGRVEYSSTSGGNNYQGWQRITSVVVDAPGCQVRIHYDSYLSQLNGGNSTDRAVSLFFESIDSAEALTQQEIYDRLRSRLGRPSSITYSGGVRVLVINGNQDELQSILFGTEAQASKAAGSVSRAAQICRAAPVVSNAAEGPPSLPDTLHFIEEKLNDNSVLMFRVNSTINYSQGMTDVSADSSTCQVRVYQKTTVDGNGFRDNRAVISFRRVEKLEVAAANYGGRDGPNTEPVVYDLAVRSIGGGSWHLTFRDEEIANRVAKAMTHAVELCGGGSKEPF